MNRGGGRGGYGGFIDDDDDYGASDGRASLPPPVQDELDRIDAEITDVNAQIKELQNLKRTLEQERKKVIHDATSTSNNAAAGSSRPSGGTDYTQSTFPWSRELLNRAKKTWGIANWRHCQEGVVNAVLDGRDVICIMPTGGGKSLCYQLPAIMSPGVTVVVSPLISLSTDQCFHLREAGIPCEFMSSALSKDEANDILRRVRNTGQQLHGDEEINILFVTPERISKSKTLMSALQKAYERGRLARVVIDEAHCCSNQGHDFRPDYRKLSILRKLFPETKTTCLTATCSPSVLKDVLSTLGMPTTTEPTSAWPNRTVYFTAPLHRPNLIYQVLTRPSGTGAVYQSICDWIQEHHPGETGIVYCLSKKDTETMAEQLTQLSEGSIKADCYHADVDDTQKHRIHVRWREGRIRVVCATIAFGMGIDKPDVRFVLHSGISKSLEGYYQESGRAGRDGNRSDCLLLYRPQDASRVAGLVASEPAGREKLAAMLEYAQSSRCRKLIFRDYFEDSLQGDKPCGECDNCTDPPEAQDVSFYAWQIVNALQEMYDNGGRITVAALADLVRGLKGGQYNVAAGGGGGKRKRFNGGGGGGGAAVLKMESYGGKITDLASDDVERVIIALLNKHYLADDYNATAYNVNVYVCPGRQAIRFTRLSEEAARKMGKVIEVNVSKKKKKGGKAGGKKKGGAQRSGSQSDDGNEDDDAEASRRTSPAAKKKPLVKKAAEPRKSNGSGRKKKVKKGAGSDEEADDIFSDYDDDLIDSDEERAAFEAEMGDFIVPDEDENGDEEEAEEERKVSKPRQSSDRTASDSKSSKGFFDRRASGKGLQLSRSDEDYSSIPGVELDEDGWEVMPFGLTNGRAGGSKEQRGNATVESQARKSLGAAIHRNMSSSAGGSARGGGGGSGGAGSSSLGSGFKDEPIEID
ncbi:ATP-dependent DNA helicase [Microstroma glucosiphilum]|uniref:ATP-dependent DNA helicase n=1 Tax=Pseudomicrostroma glucosiphilum TaxID=1684307 RepID=A0A316U1V6_9BASI|nr:ATP-dependent DNA helicase [Pseudomicrostroma glucosiphilum]PWN18814.1 ATP-dependent DNA helicase [Pseudomicrostroma glucosiphilum]